MSPNRYRLAPWMLGAPRHLRDEAAAREFEAELAAAIEAARETLRMVDGLMPEQIETAARGQALMRLREREIAERSAQRRNRTVSSGGGLKKAAKQRASMAERVAAEHDRLLKAGHAKHTLATKIAAALNCSARTVRRYLPS